MAIMHAMVVEIQNEIFFTVGDLIYLDKDTIQQILDNIRRPCGSIPDPMNGIDLGATIPKAPFIFGRNPQTFSEYHAI